MFVAAPPRACSHVKLIIDSHGIDHKPSDSWCECPIRCKLRSGHWELIRLLFVHLFLALILSLSWRVTSALSSSTIVSRLITLASPLNHARILSIHLPRRFARGSNSAQRFRSYEDYRQSRSTQE